MSVEAAIGFSGLFCSILFLLGMGYMAFRVKETRIGTSIILFICFIIFIIIKNDIMGLGVSHIKFSSKH